MRKSFKVLALYLGIFAVSLVSASAAGQTCGSVVGTGAGTSSATCSGNEIYHAAYYDSSSEKYYVSIQLRDADGGETLGSGVYAGKRNASVRKNMGQPYYYNAHAHSWNRSLI